jgi:hypothetical protein
METPRVSYSEGGWDQVKTGQVTDAIDFFSLLSQNSCSYFYFSNIFPDDWIEISRHFGFSIDDFFYSGDISTVNLISLTNKIYFHINSLLRPSVISSSLFSPCDILDRERDVYSLFRLGQQKLGSNI